jgi:DNA polymerase
VSVLSIDFETRSTVDLKKSGVYVYAQHPDTDIWCMAWAFDDEEPVIWTPADGESRFSLEAGLDIRIIEHIRDGGEIRAWNAQFERVIWNNIMVPRYGAPAVKLEQWVCSAAEAAAMALPRYLGGAAHVLGVEQQKDEKGYALMLRMARPRKVNADGTATWWDVPERKEILFNYCKQDVRTERSLVKALRRLPPREREVYLLDQRINDRGIKIDLDLVRAAQIIVDVGITRANSRLDDLTGGEVTAVTNHKRLTDWLNEQDVETASVSKAAIAALLERDDLSDNVTEVLKLRVEAGRSSIAKLTSLIYATCIDGAARGLLLYHGAGTGRWTGKLIQPQNFPRGEVSEIESFITWVMDGNYEALDLIAPPIVIVLSMLRSMMTARPGHELMAGDYAAIEARVLNWLAGQDDVVKMFADGVDVYKHNATKIYGIPLEEVQKFPHRQAGKFQELGCGYQMGAAKAVSAAKTVYQIELAKELAKEIVDGYRNDHPFVVRFWRDAEDACVNATCNPGAVFSFGVNGNLKATVRGAYLYIVLPSRRALMYAGPHMAEREMPWSTEEKPAFKATLHFKGVDPFTRQWGVMSLYGGLIVENIVQAVSRDLMAEAMFRLEDAGYLPVLSVHDEVVCEIPEGFGSVQEFESLMSELPTWATGCPVAAEGWRGFRYRK